MTLQLANNSVWWKALLGRPDGQISHAWSQTKDLPGYDDDDDDDDEDDDGDDDDDDNGNDDLGLYEDDDKLCRRWNIEIKIV